MIEMLFSFVLPVILTVILIIYYREKTAIWEPFIPYFVVGLFILLLNYFGKSSLTKDSEYFGNYVTETRYYEDWDEWITKTCYRDVPCGTDKDGHTKYCSESYDCSYRDYHPEHWTIVTNDGNEHSVSEKYYNELVSKFGTGKHFHNMNRHYYTNDGDMFYTKYNDLIIYNSSFEPYFSKHTYENKIQASASVFNFPEVKEKDVKDYNLFEYPEIKYDNSFNSILTHGYKVSESAQKKFDWINGKLGLQKQVHVWVLLFNANERRSVYMQRGYWKGGNKNEFIVCLGMNKDGSVAWYEPMGWSKNKMIEIETRNYVLKSGKLNLEEFGDFMYVQVQKNWTRTSFGEFDYLEIEPPLWSIITCWVLSLLSCLGLFIWIINNEYDEKNENFNYNRRY